LLKDNQEEDIQVSRQTSSSSLVHQEEDPYVCMLQPWSCLPGEISDPREFL
jgi:hypothetical protein